MITISSGKLYVIDPVFSIDCGWLGTPFLTHLLLYVKRSFDSAALPGLAQAGGACENGLLKSSSEQAPPAVKITLILSSVAPPPWPGGSPAVP